jgi:hypothetical protein
MRRFNLTYENFKSHDDLTNSQIDQRRPFRLMIKFIRKRFRLVIGHLKKLDYLSQGQLTSTAADTLKKASHFKVHLHSILNHKRLVDEKS